MNVLPYTSWSEGMEGIFDGMPEKVYRAAAGINVSSLKAMRLSPAHYHHDLEEDDDEKRQSALVVGTLVHKARLEPEGFPGCYVVRPETYPSKEGVKPWHGGATYCKDWLKAQTLPVVTPDEEGVILRCAKALEEDELINAMAASGWREVTCFKRHKRTGLMLKGRADLVAPDEDGVTWGLDIKTVLAGMASRELFKKRISDLDYHMQDAHYRDLFGLDHFVFVAVEKKGFPGVAQWELESEDVELGRRSNEAFIQQVARCRDRGEWPAYPKGVRSIGLTKWKRKQEMEDVE